MDYLQFHRSALAKRIDEANQRLHRVGRLKWLLEDFLRRRPSERREGELLDLQCDVLAFAGTWGPEDYRHANQLPAPKLDELYDKVREGVALLSRHERWVPDLGIVEYGLELKPDSAARAKQKSVARLQRDPLADPVPARRLLPLRRVNHLKEPTTARLFLNAVLAEFDVNGERVAQCPRCDNLFARERRQAFCSIQCAQRIRDARRRDGDVSIDQMTGYEPFEGMAEPKRGASPAKRRSRR